MEVAVSGPVDPATGMIANLADLDAFVEREVIEPFDHKYLNEEVAEFREHVPTTENLCIEIFNRLRDFPHAKLERVRVEETSRTALNIRESLPERTMSEQTKRSRGTDADRTGVGAEPSESIADLVRRMLELIGEDPDRDGLRRTPERFEKALRFLTSGYQQDPEKLLNGAMFSVCYDQMVLVKDIEVYSLCEHHMLPFFGKCHVAYIPDKKVVGLSKIPRLVNMFARRLQIQERLTNQIASAIQQKIAPLGVGVVIEARHLCMVMRGVEKQKFADGHQRDAGLVPRKRADARGISVADSGSKSGTGILACVIFAIVVAAVLRYVPSTKPHRQECLCHLSRSNHL